MALVGGILREAQRVIPAELRILQQALLLLRLGALVGKETVVIPSVMVVLGARRFMERATAVEKVGLGNLALALIGKVTVAARLGIPGTVAQGSRMHIALAIQKAVAVWVFSEGHPGVIFLALDKVDQAALTERVGIVGSAARMAAREVVTHPVAAVAVAAWRILITTL